MPRINVYGPLLRFSAAHFATFGEGAEPLHGHNYALSVELTGELTEDSWVFDFVELRRIAAGLCEELDHGFLLPGASARLEAERSQEYWEIRFGDRRYVMPEADVRELPIDNSTAERLAEYLAGRVAAALRSRGASNLSSLTVTVEEAPGQSASHTLAFDG